MLPSAAKIEILDVPFEISDVLNPETFAPLMLDNPPPSPINVPLPPDIVMLPAL